MGEKKLLLAKEKKKERNHRRNFSFPWKMKLGIALLCLSNMATPLPNSTVKSKKTALLHSLLNLN